MDVSPAEGSACVSSCRVKHCTPFEQSDGRCGMCFARGRTGGDAARVRALFERARTIALATVAPTGVPRVAPVDAFLDGTAFCVPTVATSARCRHLTTNPAASLTCFEKD